MGFFSCKKDKVQFKMVGKVTDSTFGTGLEGAKAILYQIPLGGGYAKEVASAVLGSDGSYSFKFEREKAQKFNVVITKDKYFEINEIIKYDDFTPNKELVRNYTTTAKSWVKLRFINEEPSLGSDALVFSVQQGKKDCSECCGHTEHTLYGKVDTTFICINDGNTVYSYYYRIFNNTDQGIKDIVTIPFDTVTIIKTY